MIRAKFKCIEGGVNESGRFFKLRPVTSGSDENKNFYKYTPAGLIEQLIVNDNVYFEVGKEYDVDFSEVVAISAIEETK